MLSKLFSIKQSNGGWWWMRLFFKLPFPQWNRKDITALQGICTYALSSTALCQPKWAKDNFRQRRIQTLKRVKTLLCSHPSTCSTPPTPNTQPLPGQVFSKITRQLSRNMLFDSPGPLPCECRHSLCHAECLRSIFNYNSSSDPR